MSANCDIRGYAKMNGVYLYEVATALGVSEPTIMRRLRAELSDNEKCELRAVIDRIAEQHVSQIAAASAQ